MFVGAGLVFLVQPMIAKMILPLFGGAPAVWTTSMVFFQAVLLAGYTFAHVSRRALGARRQPFLQIGIVAAALLALPIGRHLVAPPEGVSEAFWLLGVLAVTAGVPYFVVTTASPVLQTWFARSDHPSARDPYFLYAAGNGGSLLALVAYPLLVEPHLSLSGQANLWTGAYVAFAVLSIACWALSARREAPDGPVPAEAASTSPPIAWRSRARWVFMAFVPSSLMLGAATFISTDIAAVPLLWVLPLAVYLVTFILAFASRQVVSVETAGRVLPVLVLLIPVSVFQIVDLPIVAVVVLHLATLFFGAVLAHGRLASERPAADRLTEFYVMLSIGGVLGGVFNALVAPRVFDAIVEYPIALLLVLLLRPRRRLPRPGRLRFAADLALPAALVVATFALVAAVGDTELPVLHMKAIGLIVGTAAVVLLLFASHPIRFPAGVATLLLIGVVVQSSGLYVERTFFGVVRVAETAPGEHTLVHGTTVHGVQRFDARTVREPLTYYSRSGPIGDVFDRYQKDRDFDQVDVIGLGIGSLAAYGRPGQSFSFFEIDPAVVRIASNPELFTFLRDSRSDVDIVLGDGRRTLADAPRGASDLVVVDAFSSDSIPVHLLTKEAVHLYFERLGRDGLLALHVSNRHLELAPVVSAVARELGLSAAERRDRSSRAKLADGMTPSHWIVLAESQARLDALLANGWTSLAKTDSRAWTDDFSNILGVLAS